MNIAADIEAKLQAQAKRQRQAARQRKQQSAGDASGEAGAAAPSFRTEKHVMNFQRYRKEPKADDFADAVVQGLTHIPALLKKFKKVLKERREVCENGTEAIGEGASLVVRSYDVGPKHCAVAQLRVWSVTRWRLEFLFNVNFLEGLSKVEAERLAASDRVKPTMNCQNVPDTVLIKILDAYFVNPQALRTMFGAPWTVDAYLIERQPMGFRARGSKNALISYILMQQLYTYQRSWPGGDGSRCNMVSAHAALVSAKLKLKDVDALLQNLGIVAGSDDGGEDGVTGMTTAECMVEAMARMSRTRCGPSRFAKWQERFYAGGVKAAVKALATAAKRAGRRSSRTTSNIRYRNNKVWSAAVLGCLLLQQESWSQRSSRFSAQLLEPQATSTTSRKGRGATGSNKAPRKRQKVGGASLTESVDDG